MPDADPDHRRDLGRERRDVEHAREQRDHREPDADAEQRGHDRQAHREQRSEREQQDEDRGEDADRLARGLRLVGEHRAAELDLQTGRVRALLTIARMCVARSTGTSFDCTSNRISAYAILPSLETKRAFAGSYGELTETTCGCLRELAR